MTNEIHKIVYCSRNLIEGDDSAREAEVANILDTARRNNRHAGVTGALLFSAGYFAQALEGPQSSIEAIFERIQRDNRHGAVTVLESVRGTQRDFSQWSMAYVPPPSGEEAAKVQSALRDAMSLSTGAGEGVLELLRSLVLQED
jgi:hypothetical protein